MKRRILLMLLPMLLAVGCGREGDELPQSRLYKHYASQDGLTVAQVDGFLLCDTVAVDVVMLQADNDEAWQLLCNEFDVRDTETVVSWLGNPDEPAQRVKWSGNAVMRVVASHKRHTIAFYRLDNEQQYDALVDYQMGEMKK